MMFKVHRMNKKYAALLAIVLLGAFLRFYDIGAESFWLDESATAMTIKRYSANEISSNIIKYGNILPSYYSGNMDLPIYYVLLEYWTSLFGLDEAGIRSFSAVFGVLSIILVYILAKNLFSEKTGLTASLIFSLSAVMIEFSQEARLYSFLIFIALASSYFLFKMISTKSYKHISYFVIINIIGIYTHYPFLFFVIFELFFVAILAAKEYLEKKKTFVKREYLAVLILPLFYLPLLPRLLEPKLVATHFFGSFSLGKLAKMFLQLNTWFYPSESLRQNLGNLQLGKLAFSDWVLIASVVLITVILSFYSAKNFFRLRKITSNHTFLLLWIAVPFAVAFAVLFRSIATFGSIRHFIFIVPPYFILSALGMSKLKGRKFIFLIVSFLVLSVFPIYSYYGNVNNPQYKEAVRFLESNATKELIIVNLPSVAVPFNYYSDKLENVKGVNNLEEAEKLSLSQNSLWLVLSTKYADKNIDSYFKANYRLAESKSFHDISIYHYRQ